MSTGSSKTQAIATPPGGVWIFTRTGLLWAGLLALAFVGLSFRWFYTQHLQSSTQMEDWGHAYVIPLISGYLVHRRQGELQRAGTETFWPALAPLMLGVMSYFFCVVGIKNHMLQGFSLIIAIFGLLLLLLGPRAMRVLFLPIAFLVFGVSISEKIMTQVTFPLQLLATQGAYLILNVLGAVAGFSCDASGNMLSVTTSSGETHPLNVAAACSGMRMVVAFCALGGATALLTCREWWQRILVVLLAPAVAIVVNIVRVAVLGLLSMKDENLASGDAHVLVGTILLIPGLGLFLAVVWALNRIVSSEPKPAGAAA